MEPLTAATTFASIVGLLSNFKSEQLDISDDEYRAFLEWLESKRHRSIIAEINSNHSLGLGIKHLLQESHKEVVLKLQALDSSIVDLASQLSGFTEIAAAISPVAGISDQAVSILDQLNKSNGSWFLELRTIGGTEYGIMDGNGGVILFTEERFIEDDLETLSVFGFLIADHNSHGERIWRITRRAVKYLAAIGK